MFSGIAALAQTAAAAVPELITDRPDRRESSVAQPKGFFQVEVGWEFTRNDQDGSLTDKQQCPATLIRLGILDRTELLLG